MQHRLNEIAHTRRLDTVLFVDFAVGHNQKYSVDLNLSKLPESTVSTWHVDQLVSDFRKALDDCQFIAAQL